MPNTRLIIVEGLPGSGKSTTAQFLAVQLRKNGYKSRWYYEEEVPHPIAGAYNPSHYNTWEGYFAGVLSAWRSLVLEVERSDEIVIIESWMFQNALFLLLRHDVDKTAILSFMHKVKNHIHCLNPVILYFFQADYSNTLRKICDARGKWLEEFYITRIEQSPFGQRRGLKGFQGLIRFWEEIEALAEQLFSEFDVRKLAIDTSEGGWGCYYRQICGFLSLRLLEDDPPSEAYLNRYVGTYTYFEKDVLKECSIRLENSLLVIHDMPGLWPVNRIIPKEKNIFYAEAWPFELIFEEDDAGAIRSVRTGGQEVRWGRIAHVFTKA